MRSVPASHDRAHRPAVDESGWGPLYRAGSIAAGLAVVLYGVALVIVSITTSPPTSGGAAVLEYVATHRSTYIVRQLLWLTPSLLLMVTFLALAVALRHRGRGLAAIAGLIAVASWAVSLAWPTTGDGSLAMVVLSDKYLAAGPGDRAPFVAGAEVLIALNDVPAVVGVVQTIGILLVALLMLRDVPPQLTGAGRSFSRRLAWLGVATGAIGIISEVLRPVLGWAYATYGLLLFAWLLWLTIALWKHASRTSEPPQRTGAW